MAIIKGLKQYKRYEEEAERARATRDNRVEWLSSIWSAKADPDVKIKSGGKVEIIFLQELDESSSRYSEKNGLGLMAVEHNNPSKAEFWRRILCTNDEEHDFQCWGCEKNRQEWAKSTDENKYNGGWKSKVNFYINVLARYTNQEGDDVEKVFVLQRTKSQRGNYLDEIIEYAEEDGFISNRTFHLSRKGEGFDTVYRLQLKDEDAGVNVEDYELFDIDNLLNDVDYEDQAEALGVTSAPKRVDLSVESDPEDDDSDWL